MTPFEAVDAIYVEYNHARAKFPKMHSPHEGFAILKEEVDELWDEVKTNGSKERLRAEAIQVAAMALAIVVELT